MKRLFIIASLAILAVGCQKTEIQNEVQNQIGFSTETGKMTRAIVQNDPSNPTANVTYPSSQPFGVYAYGWQKENDGSQVTGGAAGALVMNNVEVSYTEATANTAAKWAVTTDNTTTTKYYWPNDPRTTLNFYAYSPAQPTTGVNSEMDPHQELTGRISHNETDGLALTDYVHSNMYVDFMVATPVLGATYSDQDGTEGTATSLSSVPLSFGHKMTQVNFTVKIADTEQYPNVDFTINSIVLNNIVSNGTYTYDYTPAVKDENGQVTTQAQVTEAWGDATSPATASYKIYPATKVPYSTQTDYPYSYGAPALTNAESETSEVVVILETDAATPTTKTNPGRSFSTTPVTMIPQTLTNTDAQNDVDQSFTISYTISGTGVATETVVKTFDFADASATAPAWEANKKITYTLTIGLNEITFSPTVANWSDGAGAYYNPDNIAPAGSN